MECEGLTFYKVFAEAKQKKYLIGKIQKSPGKS